MQTTTGAITVTVQRLESGDYLAEVRENGERLASVIRAECADAVERAREKAVWILRTAGEDFEAAMAAQLNVLPSLFAADVAPVVVVAPVAPAAPAAAPIANAASDKQCAFIAKLAAERGTVVATAKLTKAGASRWIDELLRMPKVATAKVAEPGVVARVTECGMYRNTAGDLFKVQQSATTGGLYAKKLQPIGGQRLTEIDTVVGFEFVYAPGAMRELVATDRLSLEDAKAFGIKYGVCCVCGRTLKDATSVAAGIGPICATKV